MRRLGNKEKIQNDLINISYELSSKEHTKTKLSPIEKETSFRNL